MNRCFKTWMAVGVLLCGVGTAVYAEEAQPIVNNKHMEEIEAQKSKRINEKEDKIKAKKDYLKKKNEEKKKKYEAHRPGKKSKSDAKSGTTSRS